MLRLGAILLGFAYMVLLIESLRVGVAWWRGELQDPEPLDWVLLGALPALAWIWWRYLSIFRPGCDKAHCRLSANPPTESAGPPKPGH